MLARTRVAAALVAALPLAASADIAAETAELRAELAALRLDYDARIEALERRLAAAEANDRGTVAAFPSPPAPPVAPSPPTASAAASTAGVSAFNPAMSVILDGKYRSLEHSPDTYRIGGFIPGGEESGPGERSFDLGESELTLSASIDPYFSGYFVAALDGDGSAEVEEAYLTHVGLVPGATVKFGRYKAGFGYQNEQHAHAWDFVDTPLALDAFFGGQLADDGLQVRWLAPTDLFIELGAEAGRGAEFPGSDRNRNAAGSTGLFAHVGGDLGSSWSYRMGGSYRWMHAQERGYDDTDAAGAAVVNRFTGDVDTWGLDAVWKWAPGGERTVRNLTLQAEYLHARSDGALTFDADGAALTGDYDADQSGWYAQAVYQFMPRWRVGARYDALDSGSVDLGLVNDGTLTAADFPALAAHDPTRWTSMVDFSLSEFSRLRLQFARDGARFDGSDDQFFFQYIMSMGAHGAHRF
jgi:hypothetical protein